MGLHVESIEWKRILGKLLSQAYKERVIKMMQFINDRMKTMGKKIKDLDDVKFAMLCLEMIREEFIGYGDVLNYGCFEISNEIAKVILVNRKITEWTWSWILLKRATQLFINSILIFQKTMRTWCTVYVMLSKICF